MGDVRIGRQVVLKTHRGSSRAGHKVWLLLWRQVVMTVALGMLLWSKIGTRGSVR